MLEVELFQQFETGRAVKLNLNTVNQAYLGECFNFVAKLHKTSGIIDENYTEGFLVEIKSPNKLSKFLPTQKCSEDDGAVRFTFSYQFRDAGAHNLAINSPMQGESDSDTILFTFECIKHISLKTRITENGYTRKVYVEGQLQNQHDTKAIDIDELKFFPNGSPIMAGKLSLKPYEVHQCVFTLDLINSIQQLGRLNLSWVMDERRGDLQTNLLQRKTDQQTFMQAHCFHLSPEGDSRQYCVLIENLAAEDFSSVLIEVEYNSKNICSSENRTIGGLETYVVNFSLPPPTSQVLDVEKLVTRVLFENKLIFAREFIFPLIMHKIE